ncbi:MAG: [FeFe] hydrogenase H-cluster radical SAM maturase HydG [Candidatus Krumholzibacteria bacterium]|nr:[FeFe] hydrogenase H-cluster radical SAM maturase HydG [Candidatus Krumholzibacteria bacterium]
MSTPSYGPCIDAAQITAALARHADPTPQAIREILAQARDLNGLRDQDVAVLLANTDRDLDEEVFHAARVVKETIYGNRLVLFAPLYITNKCRNDCRYCAFRVSNKALVRRDLTPAEIARETQIIIDEGHKRILLVAGEQYPGSDGIGYVCRAIETIYGVKSNRGEIRRLNVNVAALAEPDYRRLNECGIGTYQLFQETYHRPTYQSMHVSGPKSDYDWHLEAMDRAMTAGIEDVGIGALFGLYDYRFEVLALLHHARHLEDRFGVGPHTISVPRIEPAAGSAVALNPPAAVRDHDFLRLIAILRLAVPYTGIILSTRENATIRRQCFALGVSQISASSRTNPGGYSEAATGMRSGSQFSLGDHRNLDEVIADCLELGYLPSFCTACYRSGRTGADFMELAKPGLIKEYCQPNAILTIKEYLQDYASEETRALGERLIGRSLEAIATDGLRCDLCDRLVRIANGERDLFY